MIPADMNSLKGQVALVTGGGAGIGRAISRALADHGAHVYVCDIVTEGAEETARLIRESGGNASVRRVDVTDETSVAQTVAGVLAEEDGIDLLYNNAGITSISEIRDLPASAWDKLFDVNCKGVFLMSKHVIPSMTDRGRGRIINTASQAGKGAVPLQSHYAASKAAVIGFTRSLAIELKDTGIRVNCFCPGSVMTEMTKREAQDILDLTGTPIEESIQAWESEIPLGRWVLPEDVAKVAVFLATDYAEYMTGQAVNISGGQTLI